MYQFTRAPQFLSGSDITANSISKLANAFNDRIKSGIADCSRRIHIYNTNILRNIRNPDESLFLPQIEALTFYNHLRPEVGSVWAEADFGDPQGGNLASPVPQFIGGNSALLGEGDRLSALVPLDPGPTPTPLSYWNLSKTQRGGIDTGSNVQYVPFLSASQEHFRIVHYSYQFYGKSPGGYLPSPVVLGECSDGTYTFPNLQIKFTNINTLAETTFGGTCGPSFGGSDTDVQWVQEFPFKWTVYQYNGTQTDFPKDTYIQGPYEGGGLLQKENGDQINRLMLNSYIKEFKGQQTYEALHISASSSPYPIKKSICYNLTSSFNFQDYLTRQHQLAPAYAFFDGDSLNIEYPTASWTSNQSAGITSTPYTIHSGFVLGGYFFKGVNLTHNTLVQVLANDTIVTQFLVKSGSLDYEDCFTIPTKVTGSISFKLVDSLDFDSPSGSLFIEFSELYEQYPQIWDGYCLLRCADTLGGIGIDTTNDKFGVDEDKANTIWENYNKYGGVVNINGGEEGIDQPASAINTNPVYESMRKYVRSYSRYLDRNQLTGYEVSSSKSVLYFKKWVNDESGDLDLKSFDGLLNPFDSGSNGIILNNTGSWSNEWVMDITLNPYHPSDSSIWKAESYSDYYYGINRALLLNSRIPSTYPDIFNFVQDGGSNFIAEGDLFLTSPEYGITFLNYDRQVNTNAEEDEPTEQFYKSCQIYPEPYYIEEIKCIGDEVKITFNKRFQHHEDAPSSIDRNIVTWDTGSLQGEDYRTDESGIRQYLVYQYNGDNANIKIGDHAANSDYDIFTDQFYGCVFPHFMFLKLLPKPYQGMGNDTCVCNDEDKTIISSELLIQSETYLFAICNGFIDDITPFACDTDLDTAFDFTYSNLCFQAFGGSRINNISTNIRTDNPQTYGPLPMLIPYSEILNQIGSCVNLLTKARLPLPFLLETNTTTYLDTTSASPLWTFDGCHPPDGRVAAVLTGIGGNASTFVSDTGWVEVGPPTFGFGCSVNSGWTGNCTDSGFEIGTGKTVVQYRFQLTDPLSVNALSSELYDNFINGTNGFFGYEETTTGYNTYYTVATSAETSQKCLCGGVGSTAIFYDTPNSIGYNETGHSSTTTTCKLYSNGVIDPGSSPTSDILCCRDPDQPCIPVEGGGGVRSIGITVTNTQTSIINIPLVS